MASRIRCWEVGVLHLGRSRKSNDCLFLTVLTGFFFRGDQTGSPDSPPHSKPPKAKKQKKRSQDSHAAAVWGPRILLRPCIAGCASARSKPVIIHRKSVVEFILCWMVVEFGEKVLGVHGVVVGFVQFARRRFSFPRLPLLALNFVLSLNLSWTSCVVDAPLMLAVPSVGEKGARRGSWSSGLCHDIFVLRSHFEGVGPSSVEDAALV